MARSRNTTSKTKESETKTSVSKTKDVEIKKETDTTEVEVKTESGANANTAKKDAPKPNGPVRKISPKQPNEVKLSKEAETVDTYLGYLLHGIEKGLDPALLVGYQKVIIDTIARNYGRSITKSDMVKIIEKNKWVLTDKGYTLYLLWDIPEEQQRNAYHALFAVFKGYFDKNTPKPNREYLTNQFTGNYLELGEKLIRDFA